MQQKSWNGGATPVLKDVVYGPQISWLEEVKGTSWGFSGTCSLT